MLCSCVGSAHSPSAPWVLQNHTNTPSVTFDGDRTVHAPQGCLVWQGPQTTVDVVTGTKAGSLVYPVREIFVMVMLQVDPTLSPLTVL